MASWLKLGYFTDAQEAEPDYWRRRTWVSDGPGRASPRWRARRRPRQGERRPVFGPKYDVGDRLVVYVTGRGVCPAILEVTAEPVWDPDRVDDRNSTEGDQWGVVTEIRAVHTLPLDEAPPLEDIGVASTSIQRKGHIQIEDWQYAQAERLIAGNATREPPTERGTSRDVPIEAGDVEGYDVASPAETRRAIRRESKLVRDYTEFLEARGDEISRNELYPPGALRPLYTDLFNKTRGQLVEAKAGTSRGDIRMAIGQLADYERFVRGSPRRAVLLEAKPHPDLLSLLTSQGISAVWRAGDSFEDNAEGAFT